MGLLAFVLECAAVAALTGAAASLLALVAFFLVRRLLRRSPAAVRADVALLLGVVPALVGLAVVTAAAIPPVSSALGYAADHCLAHGHHVHLCLVHSSGLRPVLATVGAFALATFLFRAIVLAKRLAETGTQLRLLERLGAREDGRYPIVYVPGAARLCHAVGIFQPRVLVSAELAWAMEPRELRAALAHEQAHLRRRDPGGLIALAIASLFAVPGVARCFLARFQEAAEEACDAEAAVAVANPRLVAIALVNVAGLQLQSSELDAVVPAFGEGSLERRVRRLLDADALVVAPARAILLLGSTAGVTATLAITEAARVHHAVETALHHFF